MVALLIVLNTSLLFAWSNSREQPSLAAMALQPSQLPQGSKWLHSGESFKNDISHPINAYIEGVSFQENQTLLLGYKSAYQASAELPDHATLYMGNFLYRYPDAQQAEQVKRLMISEILAVGNSDSLEIAQPSEQGGLTGQAISVVGKEGEIMYWFIGSQNETLVLLVLDSFVLASTPERAVVEKNFLDLVEILQQN
jgi:hypothetical protein